MQSFMLPIASAIVAYGGDTVSFLAKASPDDFRFGLSKWLTHFPNFQDSFSRDLSRKALTQILELSARDIELASVKLQSGAITKEGKHRVLIQ
jgi:hypothetical protein